jgi:hypothetical protein
LNYWKKYRRIKPMQRFRVLFLSFSCAAFFAEWRTMICRKRMVEG